jgi:hypothetical protein
LLLKSLEIVVKVEVAAVTVVVVIEVILPHRFADFASAAGCAATLAPIRIVGPIRPDAHVCMI